MALGPLVGTGFTGWMLYEILSQSGLLGGTGAADMGLNTGLSSIQPQMFGFDQAANEMGKQRQFASNLKNLESLAKATHLPQRHFQREMSEDLDSLLGAKSDVLARASMAPPTMQGMLASMASSGAF